MKRLILELIMKKQTVLSPDNKPSYEYKTDFYFTLDVAAYIIYAWDKVKKKDILDKAKWCVENGLLNVNDLWGEYVNGVKEQRYKDCYEKAKEVFPDLVYDKVIENK